MISDKLIRIAVKEAEKTDFQFRLGAVIFKGRNRVISKGYNHGNRYRRNLRPEYTRWECSLHAEVDAILNAKTPLQNMSMLIIRLGKFGDFLIAKPCEHCMKYIDNIGFKRIYYSIDNDHFGVVKRGNFLNGDQIIEL